MQHTQLCLIVPTNLIIWCSSVVFFIEFMKICQLHSFFSIIWQVVSYTTD